LYKKKGGSPAHRSSLALCLIHRDVKTWSTRRRSVKSKISQASGTNLEGQDAARQGDAAVNGMLPVKRDEGVQIGEEAVRLFHEKGASDGDDSK
jgi:hypothetical protein